MSIADENRVRFHLSLNVSDLDRSVAFFRTLFGMEPAKLMADYAKFEPDNPPLVLSLEPTPRPVGGPLNHLGFRMPNAKMLVEMQERLERAGMPTRREDGVECCYAKQTKFWAHDPDGTLWEVYTFEGDIDHRGMGQSEETVLGAPKSLTMASDPVVYEHRMNEPFPARVPLGDEGADEIRLRGTLNLNMDDTERERVMDEALRALKPGGRLFVHVLAGEEPVNGPQLPGPAGAVRFVPYELDPVRLLEGAGLSGVKMLKFDAKPCFVRDGVGMRELQLEGWKELNGEPETVEVMYKGPFKSVTDDFGHEFVRGARVLVSPMLAGQLREGSLKDSFVAFETRRSSADVSCG